MPYHLTIDPYSRPCRLTAYLRQRSRAPGGVTHSRYVEKYFSNVVSSIDPNPGCGGPCGDPETPVFTAAAGTPVRFRVVQPTGHQRQHGFTIYGHNWFHEPWREDSTVIWSPGTPEPTSTTIGTQGGHSARRYWNIVLRHAGGAFKQPGDYMFRTQESFQVTNGLWGIFRVTGTTTTTTPTNTTGTTTTTATDPAAQ